MGGTAKNATNSVDWSHKLSDLFDTVVDAGGQYASAKLASDKATNAASTAPSVSATSKYPSMTTIVIIAIVVLGGIYVIKKMR